MTIDRDHIDNLIARYLSGEASTEEQRMLERWMEETEANEKYFEGIRFVNQKAVASHKLVSVNVNTAWDKVHSQMKAPSLPGKQVTFSFGLWAKIAAVVVFVAGISFWIMSNRQTSSVKPETTIALVGTQTDSARTLADHSRVKVAPNSKLIYSKYFGKKNREVKLTGEATFDVAHIQDKPFIVDAEGTFIKDIGTSFTIKAYPDSSLVRVFVESGEVSFYTSDNPGIRLVKGESGTYNKKTKAFVKTSIINSRDTYSDLHKFNFQNTPLPEVVKKLNNAYGTNIQITDESLMNQRITVSFCDEDVNSIITIISETLGLNAKKTANGYLLSTGQ